MAASSCSYLELCVCVPVPNFCKHVSNFTYSRIVSLSSADFARPCFIYKWKLACVERGDGEDCSEWRGSNSGDREDCGGRRSMRGADPFLKFLVS